MMTKGQPFGPMKAKFIYLNNKIGLSSHRGLLFFYGGQLCGILHVMTIHDIFEGDIHYEENNHVGCARIVWQRLLNNFQRLRPNKGASQIDISLGQSTCKNSKQY